MGFRRKPALTAREIGILVGIGAATLVVANILIGAGILAARTVGGGGSFYAVWTGARAVLWQHADPYGAPAIRLAQLLSYGRPAVSGEDPYVLTIPFYLLPIYFPFALTTSPAVARGIWIALSQAALVGTAFLALRVTEWRPGRTLVLAYSMLGVVGVYSVMALLDGAPVILLGLLFMAVLWSYGDGRDELAGALLALSLFGWEAGGIFTLLIVMRIFHERRWNVLAGAAMVLVILGIISFLIYPGWFLPFLAATLAEIRASNGLTTQAGLSVLFPNQAGRAGQALAALLAILLVYEWWTGRDADFRRFVWTACLALAVTPLFGFRTELSNLVVLLPGVAVIGAAAMRRPRYGTVLAVLFLALTFFAPWYLYLRWIAAGDAGARGLLFLAYPVLILAGLYWTRWWFIRPRQTWLDQVRDARGPA